MPSGGSADDEKPCVSAECGQARGVAAAENLLTPAVLGGAGATDTKLQGK